MFLIFVALFWMYGGYAWLTNQVPPVSATRRMLLIAGMAAFFVCALGIPRAFADTGLAFGLGYLLAVLVHGGLYARVHGRAVLRFVPFNAAGAACGIIASQQTGTAQYVLWIAPIALQYVASFLARGVDESARTGFDIRPSQFVERHGGLLIVAFGESVVAVGITSLAAGVKLTMSTIDARLPLGPGLLLAGGIALYLLGDTLFRRAMHIPRSVYRLGAAALALLTVVLGTSVAGLAQPAALLATMVVMLILEARCTIPETP